MTGSVLTLEEAWELTGAMSSRRLVRAADIMASGEVVNTYSKVHPIDGLVPRVPWAVYLAERGGGFRLILADFDQKTTGSATADAAQFVALLDELARDKGIVSLARRYELARKAFAHTAAYDAAIAAYLARTAFDQVKSCYEVK